MKPREILLLFLVLGIALFFRFYRIADLPPGLYPDEAMNGSNAEETLQNGGFLRGKVFYPENNGREGLFINIQAAFLRGLTPPEGTPEPWMLRLPSAIFGFFTVLGVFFLARELFRRSGEKKSVAIGLVAAFFLATSFWHINFSRIGFRAIMAPFFFVWGSWLLLLAIRKGKVFIPLLAGIVYGLGFHSYIAYRATPLIPLTVFFAWKKEIGTKNMARIASIFIAGAALVSVPLLVYFAGHPGDFFGRTSQVSIFSTENPAVALLKNGADTFGMFFFRGDMNWRHNLPGAPEFFWPVAILFAAALLLGIAKLARRGQEKERNPFIFLLSGLIVAALPVVVSSEGIPHALRAILMIPSAIILAAWAGVAIHEWLLNKNIHTKACAAFIGLFFAMVMVQAYYAYFIEWGESPETAGAFTTDYAAIARSVNALPPQIPKYVIVEAGGVDVRGIPMPAQTVMFLTDSFTLEKQNEKNIRYVLPGRPAIIPKEAAIFAIR